MNQNTAKTIRSKRTTLSTNIIFHRKQNGFSQKTIAAALGVKHPRYGAWEEGRAKPPHEYLVKLAETYGITVDQLLKPREDEAAGVQPGATEGEQGGGYKP